LTGTTISLTPKHDWGQSRPLRAIGRRTLRHSSLVACLSCGDICVWFPARSAACCLLPTVPFIFYVRPKKFGTIRNPRWWPVALIIQKTRWDGPCKLPLAQGVKEPPGFDLARVKCWQDGSMNRAVTKGRRNHAGVCPPTPNGLLKANKERLTLHQIFLPSC